MIPTNKIDKNLFCLENNFTSVDYIILREAIAQLPLLLATIVQMRFWENNSIIEIASKIGVPEEVVGNSLVRAFRDLREYCLMCPDFSRSICHEVISSRPPASAA